MHPGITPCITSSIADNDDYVKSWFWYWMRSATNLQSHDRPTMACSSKRPPQVSSADDSHRMKVAGGLFPFEEAAAGDDVGMDLLCGCGNGAFPTATHNTEERALDLIPYNYAMN
jgi:hypothetical protein